MKNSNFFLLLFLLCFSKAFGQELNNAAFVDPFIGTGGHGHTYPGATVPYGMVQLSPDTRIYNSWDGCSGYHYSDSIIYGFTHTHLSGTGCSDYGDILFMPTVGEPSVDNKKYASSFSHSNEIASPGYYAVKLNNGVKAELTATKRVGFHKYTFRDAGFGNIILDLNHRDKTLESALIIVDNNHIEGMRRSSGWAANQYIYFCAEFSNPIIEHGIAINDKLDTKINDASGTNIKAYFRFKVKAGESIDVKVAISMVSTDGAHINMLTELNHWDFKKVRKDAVSLWNKELNKIEIGDASEDQKKIFYTSLYHTMTQPNIAMDCDKQYRGMDNKIHKADGFSYYTVFSLWDTFRATHPLYTIIDRKRTLDFIKTFLAQYQQGGLLPVWELSSNETNCMIGYHSVSVIADAYTKGIRDFDVELALEAMKKSANNKIKGLPAYADHGFLDIEDESESVSKTLEYAYDDWCIAQFAKETGENIIYKIFIQRAQFYKNLFDYKTGFLRPRKNGNWLTPFNPTEVNNNFTEANAWQYTFFVPQDVSGLINLMGSVEAFESKLDELFTTSEKLKGREQADLTGLIGQYAQGNEQSHHIAYLYNYIGKSWKTQEIIHRIVTKMYTAKPDGLIGNEDCGQMSAWYVMSAMGFYPVTPGKKEFAVGAPLFKEIKIHLENGKTFVSKANNGGGNNFYIQSSTLNNKPYNKSFIDYDNIQNGDSLVYEMTDKPNKEWASGIGYCPVSAIADEKILANPIIEARSKTFKNKQSITIYSNEKNCDIFYTKDGSTPNNSSSKYTIPFDIDSTTTIKAIIINSKGIKSLITSASFYKTSTDWKITILSKYHSQYTAGGDEGIIDGLNGTIDWRKGEWQGYQGQDFEAIVDLGKAMSISIIAANFLQDTRSWILMPTKVEFLTSTDGKEFTAFGTVVNTITDSNYTIQTKNFICAKKFFTNAKYIKVKAKNYGKLPDWHEGAGGDAYIFIDEIRVQ